MDEPQPVRVISVRFPKEIRESYVYVGRAFGRYDQGHELANPFRLSQNATDEEKLGVLDRYILWLDARPNLEEELAELWAATEAGRIPLGCWCGNWDGVTAPPLVCHASVLARYLTKRFVKRRSP